MSYIYFTYFTFASTISVINSTLFIGMATIISRWAAIHVKAWDTIAQFVHEATTIIFTAD